MKTLYLLFVGVVLSQFTYGQSNPEELIMSFFKEYQKNPTKAVGDIYGTNPWISRNKDAVESVKNEVNRYNTDFVGKYYGYEPITRKQFSESFVLFSYMVKYERQPMRFMFKFYKPSTKWVLYEFKIDSDLDNELEQAAKLYNINLNEKN